MRELHLGNGIITLVDEHDFYWLNRWDWKTILAGDDYYVYRRESGKNIYMHRFILAAPPSLEVDHINLNTLDNTRNNLRLATRSENSRNKPIQKNNTSGYKGVSFSKRKNKWESRIWLNRKTIHLGFYDTPDAAYAARLAATEYYYGEFAREE